MPNRALILIDLVVIPTFRSLVAEEVYRLVIDSGQGLFLFEVLEAVRFVPAVREDVKGDLAAY